MGDVVRLSQGDLLKVIIQIYSEMPLHSLEVIADGKRVAPDVVREEENTVIVRATIAADQDVGYLRAQARDIEEQVLYTNPIYYRTGT